MISLPTALTQAINRVSDTDPTLVLLEIHLEGLTEPMRLVQNEEDINWNGFTWVAFPFELDSVGEFRKGELPRLQVRVSNVAQSLQGYVDAADGGVDAEVKIYAVYAGNLSEPTPLLELVHTVSDTSCDQEWITFTLSATNTLTRRFPRNNVLKNLCRFSFKSVLCGYAGVEGECNRSLSRCRELGNSERFGGFPGVGYRGVRL